jgi:hypothetical protein
VPPFTGTEAVTVAVTVKLLGQVGLAGLNVMAVVVLP